MACGFSALDTISMKLEDIAVILVQPMGPVNVGSVCRAMMNFGFSDLRLVNPCRDFKNTADARKMALGAISLLEHARCYKNLESALKDCNTAFGTTRRIGKYRKNLLNPEQAGNKISVLEDYHKCALVLGREDNGLSSDELELCQHFVTIPTDDAFASMNLSHALCIFAYEISKAVKNVRKKNQCQDTGNIENRTCPDIQKSISQTNQNNLPADISEIEMMYSHMKKTLSDINFLDPQNPDHLLRTFRRIFGRSGLSSRDVRIIRGLMSRMDWINAQL